MQDWVKLSWNMTREDRRRCHKCWEMQKMQMTQGEVSNVIYWHTCFLLPALMTLHSRGAPAVLSGGRLTSLHLPVQWLNLELLVYYVTEGLLALLKQQHWSQNAPHSHSHTWPCQIHLLPLIRNRKSHRARTLTARSPNPNKKTSKWRQEKDLTTAPICQFSYTEHHILLADHTLLRWCKTTQWVS